MGFLAVAVVALLTQGVDGENLVENAYFTRGLDGWSPIWSRDAKAASASVATVDGKAVLRVRHTGKEDWSVGQIKVLPTRPGEIFRIGASAKSEAEGNAEASVVVRDAAGEVLDWSYGAVRITGKRDWTKLSRRLIVPPKGASVQFRLIGYGPGAFDFRSTELVRVGSLSAMRREIPTELSLVGEGVTLRAKSDGSIELRSGAKAWSTSEVSFAPLKSLMKKGDAIEATYWDLANDADRKVAYRLSADGKEIEVSVSGEGPLADSLPLPGSFRSQAGDWLIVPMNEGIFYPVDDKSVAPMRLVAYGGHGISMPWFGTETPGDGSGVMTILETPDDASAQISRKGERMEIEPIWDPTRGTFGYTRKFRLVPISEGGYVAMARRYRNYAKKTGLLVTLAEKRKTRPNVDKLIGAVNMWTWMGEKVKLCQEMKTLGMERVLWSGGGSADEIRAINDLGFLSSRYDIYQDVYDPKVGLSWMNTAGWPEDLALQEDGTWMKGWAHPDKQADGTVKWIQGGVICSQRGLERAKKMIPEELAKVPYQCRFLDTTTASPWRECYNPAHPLTRSEDRKYKMGLLEFCSKDEGLVVGSETGVDASVPYLDYFEGMMSLGPYRLPDAGTDMVAFRTPTPEFLKYQVGGFYRLPLWELVYHDCTVAQWYWGDASNKSPEVWDRRDLLNILYGTAPLMMFDDDRWKREKQRMLQTYRNVCEWTRKIGYDAMVSHQFLSDDHNVQRTKWSSGRWCIVNFGDKAAPVAGTSVPAMGFKLG